MYFYDTAHQKITSKLTYYFGQDLFRVGSAVKNGCLSVVVMQEKEARTYTFNGILMFISRLVRSLARGAQRITHSVMGDIWGSGVSFGGGETLYHHANLLRDAPVRA